MVGVSGEHLPGCAGVFGEPIIQNEAHEGHPQCVVANIWHVDLVDVLCSGYFLSEVAVVTGARGFSSYSRGSRFVRDCFKGAR